MKFKKIVKHKNSYPNKYAYSALIQNSEDVEILPEQRVSNPRKKLKHTKLTVLSISTVS